MVDAVPTWALESSPRSSQTRPSTVSPTTWSSPVWAVEESIERTSERANTDREPTSDAAGASSEALDPAHGAPVPRRTWGVDRRDMAGSGRYSTGSAELPGIVSRSTVWSTVARLAFHCRSS